VSENFKNPQSIMPVINDNNQESSNEYSAHLNQDHLPHQSSH